MNSRARHRKFYAFPEIILRNPDSACVIFEKEEVDSEDSLSACKVV